MADSDREFIETAIQAARACLSEDTDRRPKVGAVLSRGADLIATAYRGEFKPGEHAEYTLLQGKLHGQELRDTTLFTTLEPCTTRKHPKRPCADWIIERKVQRVVVGMLDPNPVVYEQGVSRLRASGIQIDYFPMKWREVVRSENKAFIEQFHASPALQGKAKQPGWKRPVH